MFVCTMRLNLNLSIIRWVSNFQFNHMCYAWIKIKCSSDGPDIMTNSSITNRKCSNIKRFKYHFILRTATTTQKWSINVFAICWDHRSGTHCDWASSVCIVHLILLDVQLNRLFFSPFLASSQTYRNFAIKIQKFFQQIPQIFNQASSPHHIASSTFKIQHQTRQYCLLSVEWKRFYFLSYLVRLFRLLLIVLRTRGYIIVAMRF